MVAGAMHSKTVPVLRGPPVLVWNEDERTRNCRRGRSSPHRSIVTQVVTVYSRSSPPELVARIKDLPTGERIDSPRSVATVYTAVWIVFLDVRGFD